MKASSRSTGGGPTVVDHPQLPDSHKLPPDTSMGDALSADRFIGKVPVALVYCGTAVAQGTGDVVHALDASFSRFSQLHTQVLGLVDCAADELDIFAAADSLIVTLLADPGHAAASRFGLPDEAPATVILDRDGEAVARVEGGDADAHIDTVIERIEADRAGRDDTSSAGAPGDER